MVKMKDYLGYENARNKRNARLYTELMRAGLGEDVQVMIGHHLTFEVGGNLETENEIPSADCLMFDHELMGRVFGDHAIPIMQELATLPCDERDVRLETYFAIRQRQGEEVAGEGQSWRC